MKVRFKNGINGTWQDLSTDILSSLCGASAIKRRVESMTKGETGVIGLDKVNLTFYNAVGGTIYNAFNTDLSALTRYIFEIYAYKNDGTEVKQFEGIADFLSINRPDFESKISFDVVDKLSAVDLIVTETGRTTNNPFTRIGMSPIMTDPQHMNYYNHSSTILLVTKGYEDGGGYHVVDWDTQDFGDPDQLFFEKGEVIDQDGTGQQIFVVKDSYLASAPQGYDFSGRLVNYIEVIDVGSVTWDRNFTLNMIVYDDLYYGVDIYSYTDNKPEAIDGSKIVKALYEQVWGTTTIIYRTGGAGFIVPMNYILGLLDENPLGKHPFEAFKLLANSMQCYIFINKAGELVFQKRNRIGSDGTTRTFNPILKRTGNKKDFWDKLADGVTVTVTSTIVIDGENIIGVAALQKRAGSKPRNPLKIEVIAPSNIEQTQQALNAYAQSIAIDAMNFYGKRHELYDISSGILDDMLDWELLDPVVINGQNYFLENTSLDEIGRSFSFNAPSVTGYDYDRQQVSVALSKDNYAALGGSNGSTTNISYSVIGGDLSIQPKKAFSHEMFNTTALEICPVEDKDFVDEIIILCENTFPAGMNLVFRLNDGTRDLFTLDNIPGKLEQRRLYRHPIAREYNTNSMLSLIMTSGTQPTRGDGFIVVKKYKVG